MKGKLRFKAIACGVALDLGSSLIFGGLMGLGIGICMAAQGKPITEIVAFSKSITFALICVPLGLLSTFAGGWLAGKMARQAPFLNALAVGILSELVGLVMWSGCPLWLDLSAIVLNPAAAALGGWLVARKAAPGA